MKGLIIKDLLILSKNLKFYAIFLVLYSGFSVYSDAQSSVIGIFSYCLILTYILTLSSFSYDDMTNFQTLALTMPVTKKAIVASKYTLYLIFVSFSCIIALILAFAINIDFIEFLMSSLLAVVSLTTVLNLTLPLIIKFSVEKSRYLIMVIFFAVFAFIGLFTFENTPEFILNIANFVLNANTFSLIGFAIGFVIISFFISYSVSVKFIENKEF